jgi:hypothetical protein
MPVGRLTVSIALLSTALTPGLRVSARQIRQTPPDRKMLIEKTSSSPALIRALRRKKPSAVRTLMHIL